VSSAEQAQVASSCAITELLFGVQGQLSCLTKDGKVIMATEHAIAQAPDGNGGVYIALEKYALSRLLAMVPPCPLSDNPRISHNV
jgi:hypothetical protein